MIICCFPSCSFHQPFFFFFYIGDHRASPPLESSLGFTNNKQNCYSLKNVKKKNKKAFKK